MPKDIQQDLERVLEYMRDSEEAHYQEWFNSEDRIHAPVGEGHIYESVLMLKSWLDEQACTCGKPKGAHTGARPEHWPPCPLYTKQK